MKYKLLHTYILARRISERWNYINDQLDAKITILLIFESAQHVSGNHLSIFRSVRL